MHGLNKCPICGGKLIIKEYYCTKCHSTIKGEFAVENFLNLSQENLQLLIDYLKLRGNLKELGKQMGVSYPTIRLRFDELLKELGIKPVITISDENSKNRIIEILDAIDKGELDVKKGMEQLRQLEEND